MATAMATSREASPMNGREAKLREAVLILAKKKKLPAGYAEELLVRLLEGKAL